MKLVLKIEMNNAAFDYSHGAEVARILRAVASDIEDSEKLCVGETFSLHDDNGNTVGSAGVEEC